MYGVGTVPMMYDARCWNIIYETCVPQEGLCLDATLYRR